MSSKPQREIVFKGKAKPDQSTHTLQSIPCKIDYTGKAPVSSYFVEEKLPNGNKAATFRGRLLYGQEVQLPENYSVFVTKEKDVNSGSNRAMQMEATVNAMHYWDHDYENAPKSSLHRAINFLKIANDLSCIDSDDA